MPVKARRVATGPRDSYQNKCGNFESNYRVTIVKTVCAAKTNHSFSTPTLLPYLILLYLHVFFFIRLITDLFSIPWLLVLVTRSLTLDILSPTPRCHSHTLNSISNAGVTMMRNRTLATHMVREIQVQHILLATLLTTTTLASMTTVSITPHSSSALISSQPECLPCLPCTIIFCLCHFCRPSSFTEVLIYFYRKFPLHRHLCLIVLTFYHRLR
jgi:hypothetical protein